MEPPKHQYIDSLRGIAILLVLSVHNLYLGSGGSFLPKALTNIIDLGQFGVQLFFVVSAYTLMASFYTRSGHSPHATRNFFVRRIFRIVPMYYLAILYFSIQTVVGFQYFSTGEVLQPTSYGRLLSNLSFLHGFSPYWMNTLVPGGWSIAVEMTFYLLLPLLCRKIKTVNSALLLVMGSLIFGLLMEQLLRPTFLRTNEYLFYYFPNQFAIFSLGILAFFIQKDGVGKPSMAVWCMLAATVIISFFIELPIHFILSAGFALVLLWLAKKPFRVVVNGFFTKVGKVSYSMYFVHFAVMYWITRFGIAGLLEVSDLRSALLGYSLRFTILFLLSFLISLLTYNFIEIPFQRAGALLIARLKKKGVLEGLPQLPVSETNTSLQPPI